MMQAFDYLDGLDFRPWRFLINFIVFGIFINIGFRKSKKN